MSRNFPDLITAYVKYASVTEAPARNHFWSAVSMIAGCLRRRVWIDMKRFAWYPSFYIVFVGPPGIIAKSTTIDIATDLLRQVPGVKFGPNAITWQALVTAFASASESFEYEDAWHPMSPITLVASELGSLLDLQDKDMIDLLIELWDGRKTYEKITKMSGNDIIEAPWINLIAGTTPHWIADNMPAAMVGGGLSSRCIFIYGDQKEKYIAYVDEQVQRGDEATRAALIEDLERVALLCGRFRISDEARAWGRDWYERFWRDAPSRMDSQMLEGYAARKQTHLHKTAMVLAVSRGDKLVIEKQDLELANFMLEDLERDMPKVFSRMGRTEESLNAEKLVDFVRRAGEVPYSEAYRMVHTHFPKFHDYEGVLQGAIQSGQLTMLNTAKGLMLVPLEPKQPSPGPSPISPDTVI